MVDDTTGTGFSEENDLDQSTEDQGSQTPAEGTTKGSGDGTGSAYYTPDELAATHPKDWDIEKIDPKLRPAMEKVLNETKELKAAHTRATQELAEIRKTHEPEVYFSDPKMNTVFNEYMKIPSQIIGEINTEIQRLRQIPRDSDDYDTAQAHIDHWKGIKETFQARRMEVLESRTQAELSAAKVKTDLGASYNDLKEYAVTMGFTEDQFVRQPQLREAVKNAWTIANAGKTADRKAVKDKPSQKVAGPSGTQGGGGEAGGFDPFDPDPKISASQRIEYWRSQRK